MIGRKFANPTYFPDLYRRQVEAYALAQLRRASNISNAPRLTLVQSRDPQPVETTRGLTNRTPRDRDNDGRSRQSA